MAEDTVAGIKGYYKATLNNYVVVNQSGTVGGVYLLTETTDGNTDIEVYSSALQLITGNSGAHYRYYSGLSGHTLAGKPRFIRGATDGTTKNAYLVATDQGLWRLNKVGMQTMDDWNTMFYDTPEIFDPQCSFLIPVMGNVTF